MTMIKLKQEIELNAKIVKDKIICYDLNTVNLLLGTSAAGANLHIYGGKKISGREWEIPITSITNRINELEKKIQTYQYRLAFMKQVVNQNVKNTKKTNKK